MLKGSNLKLFGAIYLLKPESNSNIILPLQKSQILCQFGFSNFNLCNFNNQINKEMWFIHF